MYKYIIYIFTKVFFIIEWKTQENKHKNYENSNLNKTCNGNR